MSKMPCMNNGLVTFTNFGVTYWIDKDLICGKGGPFIVDLAGIGNVNIDPRNKVATDCNGRKEPITCKLLKGGPDEFGVEVAIGNPKIPPSSNLNAFHTKIVNFGIRFPI